MCANGFNFFSGFPRRVFEMGYLSKISHWSVNRLSRMLEHVSLTFQAVEVEESRYSPSPHGNDSRLRLFCGSVILFLNTACYPQSLRIRKDRAVV